MKHSSLKTIDTLQALSFCHFSTVLILGLLAFDNVVHFFLNPDFLGEQEFLKFVKGAIEWRKKWHYAEMERQRLNVIVTEKENELAGKDHQVLHNHCIAKIPVLTNSNITN